MSTADAFLAAGFWCFAAGVVYAYLVYPVLMYILSHVFGREPASFALSDAELPRISLLIAAHNEAAVIEHRIQNALALDYPADRLDIVFASDGSDDGTADICLKYENRIRAMLFPIRRGKPATLNAAIPLLNTEIVVLSDANTFMDSAALRQLVRWFSSRDVGAVCGRLVLSDPLTGRNADGLYWRYETFLKRCEGRLGGLLGANGAIYAVRRELFTPLPPGTIVDDFVIPLAAKLHSGCRIIYDPQAIAFEETAPDMGGEFRRRARIGVGGFQALTILWPLLSPSHGWTAFTLWSHKVLRWICPFLMLGAFVTAAALIRHPVFRVALIAQVVFYAASTIVALPSVSRLSRVARILPMFAGMNLALLVGFFRWVGGNHTGIWRRTARVEDRSPATSSARPVS